MRTIGIIGPAYCGMTILNLILDGLPGVVGVGESHWMLSEGRTCRIHSDSCPVFTREFVDSLQADPRDWWQRIAEQSGAETVVSADKRPVWFEEHGLPDMVIILYRDPRAWVASWLKRHPGDPSEAIKILIQLYGRCLAWVEKRGLPWVGFNFDWLRVDPGCKALAGLVSDLGLDGDANQASLFWDNTHHFIGGNKAYEPHVMVPYDYRWVTALPAGGITDDIKKAFGPIERRLLCL